MAGSSKSNQRPTANGNKDNQAAASTRIDGAAASITPESPAHPYQGVPEAQPGQPQASLGPSVEPEYMMRDMFDLLQKQHAMLKEHGRRMEILEKNQDDIHSRIITEFEQPPSPKKSTNSAAAAKRPRSPSPLRKRQRAPLSSGSFSPRRRRRNEDEDDDLNVECPLVDEITIFQLPKGWETRPPSFDKYDGHGDPDSHLRKFTTAISYATVKKPVYCKMFPLSLEGAALNWYAALPPKSISSWEQLKKEFRGQFVASKSQLKSEDALGAIRQRKDESLRSYLDRFVKEARDAEDVADNVKLYIFRQGLISGSLFHVSITLDRPKTYADLLERARKYMTVDDRNFPGQKKNKDEGSSRNHKEGKGRQERQYQERKPSPPRSRFPEYTALNATRSHILEVAEFREAGFRRPAKQKMYPSTDRNKYCRWHKGVGHNTDDCWHLRDCIEQLVREGKLQSYIKSRGSSGRREHRRTEATEDDSLVREGVEPVANVITGGHIGLAGASSKTGKRKLKEISVLSVGTTPSKGQSSRPPLAFYDADLLNGVENAEVPLIVRAKMLRVDVRRILIDQGSSVDVMYKGLYDFFKLTPEDLEPYGGSDLQGFNGARTTPMGYVSLKVTFGEQPKSKTILVRFLVLPLYYDYNCIIGRPTLANLGAVASTIHLKMRFHLENDEVVTIQGDLAAARKCMEISLKRSQENRQETGVMLTSCDPRAESGEVKLKPKDKDDPLARELANKIPRPIPNEESRSIQIGSDRTKTTKIGTGLTAEFASRLIQLLGANVDLFAWTPDQMPGIAPSVACHKLALDPKSRWVAQRRRKMSEEKSAEIDRQVAGLLQAGFIKEVKYTTWLSNVVMVKKSNGKWRMCTDYTDLNKACPKDPYPLPNIDRLVDNSSGYKILSFLDAYSGYNQIPMYESDQEKTAFMTERANYCYKVMPFGLKNAGATYQRMMNEVFKGQIGKVIEVYMDDMIVKSAEDDHHLADLTEVFHQLRKYDMRLNPEKCTFGIRTGKFLGFYLTERGIEANPDKCKAVADMKEPTSKKAIQRLTGMMTALSRFISASAYKATPLFKLLRKETQFEWTPECQKAFQELKECLSAPPVLVRPQPDEELYLYLSVAEEAVSSVLISEAAEGQRPIFFASKALSGPELRYQKIEKVAFALIVAARRLRSYFLGHTIIVRTEAPIKQVLHRPDLAGRMIKWSIELSEFDIRYEVRKAIKAQVLADFAAELVPHSSGESRRWRVYVDGSSNAKGSGAGLMIENPEGLVIEYALTFAFPTSNNQAEYEACLAGLTLSKELGASEVVLHSDSQLVVSQINDLYQAKDPLLQKYRSKVRALIAQFNFCEVLHVSRSQNARADILSKLASTRSAKGHRSVIHELMSTPSFERGADETEEEEEQIGEAVEMESEADVMDPQVEGRIFTVSYVASLSAEVAEEMRGDWMAPIMKYLENGELPSDPKDAHKLKRRACSFSLVEGKLYKRGYSTPLLKCIPPSRSKYCLAEVHEGVCGQHLGARALAKKLLRAGYYWPTMETDAKRYVEKCDKCQRYADVHIAPPKEMSVMLSPWPFAWWGIDLLGPFPKAPGQVKYLAVAVDYFTKWIEALPLAKITAKNLIKFFNVYILTRFGIPEVVTTDNGTQFTDAKFREELSKYGVKHHFTSVEHPQTNGQAESANRVVLRGLRRRLDESKGNWAEELHQVLWAYRTTPHSTTRETPFRLAYGVDAVIPIEIGEASWRTLNPQERNANFSSIREELDLLEENRELAALSEVAVKQRTAARHDRKVVARVFEVGDLILRRADVGNKNVAQGKLAPNWEGPYRVIAKTQHGAYILETLQGEAIPRTWNATKLRKYFS